MAKKILDGIIARYGLPTLLGSDNGLPFISQVTQSLVDVLGTIWQLHCEYRPQNSGQVERIHLIPFEILYGRYPTMLPKLLSHNLSEYYQ